MVLNLAVSQYIMIQGMIKEDSLTNDEIVEVTRYSSRIITTSRTNLHLFGSTKAPYNGRGGVLGL